MRRNLTQQGFTGIRMMENLKDDLRTTVSVSSQLDAASYPGMSTLRYNQ